MTTFFSNIIAVLISGHYGNEIVVTNKGVYIYNPKTEWSKQFHFKGKNNEKLILIEDKRSHLIYKRRPPTTHAEK